MKTRIISGIVMGVIVAAFLALGMLVSPLFITAFVAVITAIAVFEVFKNILKIESKAAIITAGVYAFLNIFMLNTDIANSLYYALNPMAGLTSFYSGSKQFILSVALSIIYFIIAAVICLKNQGKLSLAQIFAVSAFPIVLSFAFSCLGSVLNGDKAIFHLLLLLNFSSVCDMGAYFVGVTMGKHKLCPTISPKKTVEGAVGGIVSSVIVTVILCFAFSYTDKLLILLLLTIPFCILGMIGDLFASTIKRAAEVKDYGNLIPGHGGVLDRVDSILMIAPALYILIVIGII